MSGLSFLYIMEFVPEVSLLFQRELIVAFFSFVG